MTTQRVGRKTGPKPKFNRNDVVAAAIELGIDRFTLGGVASRLGVAASAVYRIFDSRDDLVHACLGHAAKSVITCYDPATPWQEILRDWARRTWEVCEEFPGLDITLFRFPGAHIHIESHIRSIFEIFVQQGFSRSQALFALDFVGDTVAASHIGVTAMRAIDDDGRRGVEKVKDRMSDDAVFKPDDTWTSKSIADAKVEFIIRGLEQELD